VDSTALLLLLLLLLLLIFLHLLSLRLIPWLLSSFPLLPPFIISHSAFLNELDEFVCESEKRCRIVLHSPGKNFNMGLLRSYFGVEEIYQILGTPLAFVTPQRISKSISWRVSENWWVWFVVELLQPCVLRIFFPFIHYGWHILAKTVVGPPTC
jgi:hypothetical protein